MAQVITFYIPSTYKPAIRPTRQPAERGKLIPFETVPERTTSRVGQAPVQSIRSTPDGILKRLAPFLHP